jgi:hypothetical protein
MEKVNPGSGRQSVWGYPRPPRVEFDGATLAETARAYRVLETSHLPTSYIPQADGKMELLRPNSRASANSKERLAIGTFAPACGRRSRQRGATRHPARHTQSCAIIWHSIPIAAGPPFCRAPLPAAWSGWPWV